MFGPKRGSSTVGLVLFILLWIGALAALFMGIDRQKGLSEEAKANSLEAELQKKLGKAYQAERGREQLAELEDVAALFHRRDVLRRENAYLGKLLGFGHPPDAEPDEATLSGVLDRAVGRLNEFRAQSSPGLPRFQEATERASSGGLWDRETASGKNYYTKFDRLLSMLAGRMIRMESELAYYQHLREIAEEMSDTGAGVVSAIEDGRRGSLEGEPYRIEGKQSYVVRVDENRRAIEQRYVNDARSPLRSIVGAEDRAVTMVIDYVLAQASDRIDEYRRQISEEESRLEVAQDNFVQDRNSLGSNITNEVKGRQRSGDVRGQIRLLPPISVRFSGGDTLVPSMDEEVADGEIVVVSPEVDEAYINLGAEDGVVAGMSFFVYRKVPQRRHEYRGRIEVKTVLPRMSVASITDQVSRLDPISAGDSIFNKMYDAGSPVRIVFLGELSERKKARYQHLIARLGARLETEVSVLTDFVVLLDDYKRDPGSLGNIDRAQEIGVNGLTEEELLLYIDY